MYHKHNLRVYNNMLEKFKDSLFQLIRLPYRTINLSYNILDFLTGFNLPRNLFALKKYNYNNSDNIRIAQNRLRTIQDPNSEQIQGYSEKVRRHLLKFKIVFLKFDFIFRKAGKIFFSLINPIFLGRLELKDSDYLRQRELTLLSAITGFLSYSYFINSRLFLLGLRSGAIFTLKNIIPALSQSIDFLTNATVNLLNYAAEKLFIPLFILSASIVAIGNFLKPNTIDNDSGDDDEYRPDANSPGGSYHLAAKRIPPFNDDTLPANSFTTPQPQGGIRRRP